jgi:hypothetical protein
MKGGMFSNVGNENSVYPIIVKVCIIPVAVEASDGDDPGIS